MRAVGLIVAFTLLAPSASAHVFEHPKILRIGIQPDRLLVSVTYDLNPGRESLEARGLFDRNQDGILDEAEQAKLARFLEESAMLFMKVKVEGQLVKLARIGAQTNQLDRPTSATDTLGISLLYEVPLSGTEVHLEIEDRDRDKVRHVPAVVDLAAGWHVALASQGELWPAARQLQRVALAAGRGLELRLVRSQP